MKRYKLLLIIPILAVIFISISLIFNIYSNQDSQLFRSQYVQFRLVKVVEGFRFPWSVAFLPDGRMLVTERGGELNIVINGNITKVTGLPTIQSVGQGGLLDVLPHPDFNQNGWIYLTYSKPGNGGNTATALMRGRLEGTRLTNVEDLFIQNRYSSPGRHYGSRLAWTTDGKLLMSIGDRGGDPPRAQDLNDHAGKVIRLNDDGSVPVDNPLVERDDALDEIYSYGHRNIQGLVVDPETGNIWGTEHGPRGGDLLHLIKPGKNYGWPIVTRGLDYRTEETFPYARARRMEGVEEPVYEFLPTHPPSGLAFVTSNRFEQWRGNLLAGGLASERIRRVVVDKYEGNYEVLHEEELLHGIIGRIRDVREGPDGNIYVLTDSSKGALYRIEPSR